jgi:hypothetical protein
VTEPRTAWTAAELVSAEFTEPKWAVPGLLAEGANLLCGPPKLGKSWMALNLACAISSGHAALAKIKVDAGDVLYLALEDTGRRLQHRLLMSLNGHGPSDRLLFETQCPPLDHGGTQYIEGWLQRHPSSRLVIVDVLTKIRPVDAVQANRYDADYKLMSTVKALADKYQTCILVVHHVRKNSASEDFLDMVSGTNGLAGAADGILVLTRARNEQTAKLQVTGRDIEEAEYAMSLDSEHGRWTMLDGPAIDHLLTGTRKRIHTLLRIKGPMSPAQVAEELDISRENAKQTMRRMVEDVQLAHGVEDGMYEAR